MLRRMSVCVQILLEKGEWDDGQPVLRTLEFLFVYSKESFEMFSTQEPSWKPARKAP